MQIEVVTDSPEMTQLVAEKYAQSIKSPVVITPHMKEMCRLIGSDMDYLKSNKIKCVSDFCKKYNVITILKGHGTIISDGKDRIYLNTTGNPGMAKGGSGDVLSGMVASFLAQGYLPIDSAICATYIHGLAGDECSSKMSQIAMTPTDLIGALPDVFLKFKKGWFIVCILKQNIF